MFFNNKTKIVTGIIILFMVTITIFLLGSSNHKISENSNNKNILQTYNNDQYKFSFQFPSNLNVQLLDNIEYFDISIGDKSLDLYEPTDIPFNINFSIKQTSYKNIKEWFNNHKKEYEKTSNYEGVGINLKILSSSDTLINNMAAKKYTEQLILGGNEFCTSFIRNNKEYSICYNGGVKSEDYLSARTGIDEYNQQIYDKNKIAEKIDQNQKLYENIVSSIKFTE